jgi:hypothetical protein
MLWKVAVLLTLQLMLLLLLPPVLLLLLPLLQLLLPLWLLRLLLRCRTLRECRRSTLSRCSCSQQKV